MAREIGVFCGTFNPIHWGHLIMAELAGDQLGLEHVLMITSPSPPHRNNDLLDAESRFEMVVAATRDNPRLFPSRLELERQGPSFTYDTIAKIYEDLADVGVHVNLIIGEDNVQYIKGWHRSEELLQLCRLVIAPRAKPHSAPESTVALAAEVADLNADWLEQPHIGVSSSLVRGRLRADRSVLYLVPPAVNTILLEKRHYREPETALDAESVTT